MGMDLKPVNPSPGAPHHEDGTVKWGRYNWSGWRWLTEHLDEWGVDTSEFKGMNDGDPISEATCIKVAEAIEQHINELEPCDQRWLKDDIVLWRTCGGYLQY